MGGFLDGLNDSIKNATPEEREEAFKAFNILFGLEEPEEGEEVPQAVKDLAELFPGGGTVAEPEDEKPYLFVNSIWGYNVLHCYKNEDGEAKVLTLNEVRALPGIWKRQFNNICENCKDFERIGERVWKPEYKDRGWSID